MQKTVWQKSRILLVAFVRFHAHNGDTFYMGENVHVGIVLIYRYGISCI